MVTSTTAKPDIAVEAEKTKITNTNSKLKYISDADSDIQDGDNDNAEDGKFREYCYANIFTQFL